MSTEYFQGNLLSCLSYCAPLLVKNRTGTECFLVSGQLPVVGTFDFRSDVRSDKIKRTLLPAAGRRGITTDWSRNNELRDTYTTVLRSDPLRPRRRAKEDEVRGSQWTADTRDTLWWGRVSGIKATFADQSDRTRSIWESILSSPSLFLSFSVSLVYRRRGCVGKFDTDQTREWGEERLPRGPQ